MRETIVPPRSPSGLTQADRRELVEEAEVAHVAGVDDRGGRRTSPPARARRSAGDASPCQRARAVEQRFVRETTAAASVTRRHEGLLPSACAAADRLAAVASKRLLGCGESRVERVPAAAAGRGVGAWMNGGELPYLIALPRSGTLLK